MINKYIALRYPETENKSLQVSSAADELLLSTINERQKDIKNVLIANDMFGFLALNFNEYKPEIIISSKSQQKAICLNFEKNKLYNPEQLFLSPLKISETIFDNVLLKIPKSLDFFRLLLQQINLSSNDETVVFAGFMTKYFNSQIIKIAEEYFSFVQQTKAFKKARVLILTKKKQINKKELINKVPFESSFLQQYFGVFSSNNIDYATQYLLQNIVLNKSEKNILDLASGNGIIALSIIKKYNNNGWETPNMHLLDDSFLAIESSKLNLNIDNVNFHYNDNISELELPILDLIVSNPPFHFEYEINIEVSLNLFQQAYNQLKNEGRMIIVYNRHLNYKSQLSKIFKQNKIIAENSKFVVLECVK